MRPIEKQSNLRPHRTRYNPMNKLKKRLSAIERDLARIGIPEYDVFAFKGNSPDVFSEVEREIGRKLPRSLVDFYKNTNGFIIEWSGGETPGLEGKVEIQMIQNLFSREVDTVFSSEDQQTGYFYSNQLSPDEKVKLKDFYVLDILYPGNFTLLKLDPEMEEPELYLFTYRKKLTRLNLSFPQYVNLCLETRGLCLWQQYATEGMHFSDDLGFDDDFFDHMDRFFPGADLSLLSKKLKPGLPSIAKMRETDYGRLFEERVQRFEQRTGANIQRFETYPGARTSALIKAQESIQRKLPDSFIEFFASTNGLDLDWNFEQYTGRIHIPPIEMVFGGPHGKNKIEWNEEADFKGSLWFDDTEGQEFIKELRLLESPYEKSLFIGIKVSESGEPELYKVEARSETKKLEIPLSKYFNYLLEFLGAYYWFGLTTGERKISIRTQSTEYLLEDGLKDLFPDVEIEKFIIE